MYKVGANEAMEEDRGSGIFGPSGIRDVAKETNRSLMIESKSMSDE